MYELTLLAPIALSAACSRLAALGGPFCAAAGAIMAVDANSNIPILWFGLMGSSQQKTSQASACRRMRGEPCTEPVGGQYGAAPKTLAAQGVSETCNEVRSPLDRTSRLMLGELVEGGLTAYRYQVCSTDRDDPVVWREANCGVLPRRAGATVCGHCPYRQAQA